MRNNESMKAELITRHELEKNIMNGLYGELDFYAYCNTPWHSMGVQAFVNELASKKKRVRGIIFISNQPGRSHLLNPEQFKVNSNVEVLYFKNKEAFRKNKTKLLISLLCSRRKITDDYPLLYVLRPFRPDIRFGAEYIMNTGRNCNLVCIDEGVGTYKSNKEIFEEKFKGNKKDALIYAMSSVLNKILKKSLD